MITVVFFIVGGMIVDGGIRRLLEAGVAEQPAEFMIRGCCVLLTLAVLVAGGFARSLSVLI